jgi:LPXTG-motif cell wall-anchored protein
MVMMTGSPGESGSGNDSMMLLVAIIAVVAIILVGIFLLRKRNKV